MSNKGYVLIDALLATTIVMTLIYTIVPMTSLLLTEREVLSERRLISSLLHDELQLFNSRHYKEIPKSYTKKFKTKDIYFKFKQHDEFLIKGCVFWENIKRYEEEVCLYGIVQR